MLLQVLERHLFLLMVQIVVFVLLLCWLLHCRQRAVSLSMGIQTPAEDVTFRSLKSAHCGHQRRRRNSSDDLLVTKSVDDGMLKKSGSLSNLYIVEQSLFLPDNTTVDNHKKKKKKSKQKTVSGSYEHLVNKPRICLPQQNCRAGSNQHSSITSFTNGTANGHNLSAHTGTIDHAMQTCNKKQAKMQQHSWDFIRKTSKKENDSSSANSSTCSTKSFRKK